MELITWLVVAIAIGAMVSYRFLPWQKNRDTDLLLERERLEIERARIAADLSDELAANLTKIGEIGSVLGRATPATILPEDESLYGTGEKESKEPAVEKKSKPKRKGESSPKKDDQIDTETLSQAVRSVRDKEELELSKLKQRLPKSKATLSLRDVMMVVVSLAVLGTALYLIVSDRADSGSQKWAFGAVGSIIGFWLRPGR